MRLSRNAPMKDQEINCDKPRLCEQRFIRIQGQASHQFRKQDSSVTNTTHRSSIFSRYTNNDTSLRSAGLRNMSNAYENDRLPDLRVLRRANNGAHTAPTMFSVVSHSDRSSNLTPFCRDTPSSCKASRGSSLLRFFSTRRGKQLSEAQLRKKVKKHCDRGDWSRVRKLLSNHDFAEVSEVVPETNSVIAKSSSSEGKHSLNSELMQNATSRRPSYGSRNGERLSFAGKESAAAAAVIKAAAAAAMLEEGSKSENCSDLADIRSSENILHEVCRYNPPLDVIELLLTALRHRRGVTCSRDGNGRTPLHVAVACGASSVVVEALTRADPVPASMADDDKRSPLHLAVKALAYEERNAQQNQSLPRARSSPPRMSKIDAMRKMTRKKLGSTSNPSILQQERKLYEARQTVMILKNAMVTHPGQIDFKDEDITGFAPLDYAIDGSITDQAILCILIRRNPSQDLCLQPSLRTETIDISRKSRHCFTTTFADQSSSLSAVSNEPLRRRRRSSPKSRSSFSTRNSYTSQDSSILKRIEEEEMSARRHRINKLHERIDKMRVQDGLFDVFGIEESKTLGNLDMELDDQSHPKKHSRKLPGQMSLEERMTFDMSFHSVDKPPNRCYMSCREVLENPTHLGLNNSITTQVYFATDELSVGHLYHQPKATEVIEKMTDEEIYNLHLQAYLDDTIGEVKGDLKYCDDLDFLYDDPDEIDVSDCSNERDGEQGTQCHTPKDHHVPIIDICVVNHTIDDLSLELDECSEITCI